MQHHHSCAFSFALAIGLASFSPVLAGSGVRQNHGYAGPSVHSQASVNSKMPDQAYQPAPVNKQMGGPLDFVQQHIALQPAARLAAMPSPVTTPVLLVPLNAVFPAELTPAPRQILGVAPEAVHLVNQPQYYIQPKHAPEPLSFVPTDPRAVISELPSGRIFVGAPAGVYYPHHDGRKWSRTQESRPYAPPSIQIIGELSRKYMGSAVRLTQGTPAPKHFDTGPKVIWIKAQREEQFSSSPHVRHFK